MLLDFLHLENYLEAGHCGLVFSRGFIGLITSSTAGAGEHSRPHVFLCLCRRKALNGSMIRKKKKDNDGKNVGDYQDLVCEKII